MATYRYDKTGRLLGYTRSPRQEMREMREDLKALGPLVKFLVLLIPFIPIILPSVYIYNYLHDETMMHPLFSGLLAAVPFLLALWLLYTSMLFRILYFGIDTLYAAYFVFEYAQQRTDMIWSSFFALIILIIGAVITGVLAVHPKLKKHPWRARQA